jgi:hypothetical protein
MKNGTNKPICPDWDKIGFLTLSFRRKIVYPLIIIEKEVLLPYECFQYNCQIWADESLRPPLQRPGKQSSSADGLGG